MALAVRAARRTAFATWPTHKFSRDRDCSPTTSLLPFSLWTIFLKDGGGFVRALHARVAGRATFARGSGGEGDASAVACM
eukprot:2876403-Pleurochrysis_carterae.AAC.1